MNTLVADRICSFPREVFFAAGNFQDVRRGMGDFSLGMLPEQILCLD